MKLLKTSGKSLGPLEGECPLNIHWVDLRKNLLPALIFILLGPVVVSEVRSGEPQIEIRNIKKPGTLYLAIYDDKDVFESDRGENTGPRTGIIGAIVAEVAVETELKTLEIPEGTYAIALFIDTNNNKKIDTNFFGIPKEQFGFSNNVIGRLGPPSFESASFQHRDKTELVISVK